ncbi:MAG: EAL domain-containing protein, partial [Alphaproteobacteria bacterium]|nr:EAL domain-containing protein [Alphaproteobacteria bacterium]
LFGFGVIALCWIALLYQLRVERSDAIVAAVERGDSAARLFEKDTARLLKGVDSLLLLVRQAYEKNPTYFALEELSRQLAVVSDQTSDVIGLANAQGYLIRTSAGPLARPVFIGDRTHFQAQVAPSSDELYIGLPVTLRSTGKFAIQVSRRLRRGDNAFDGILVASVNPDFVEQFSRTLKLGPDSTISVRGLDGELRASYGFSKLPLKTTEVLRAALAQAPAGFFWSEGAADGHNRLVSYRTIAGYPLSITVGETDQHIFAEYERHGLIYLEVAIAFTLLAGLFSAVVYQRQASLEQLNGRFDAAISHMPQGLCMFDRDHRLVVSNRQYAKIYGLPEEFLQPGRTFREILDYRNDRVSFTRDVDRYLLDLMQRLRTEGAFSATRVLADGRTIAVATHVMKNGGWVATHEDITDRKNTEMRIEQLAHFDALTGLANRNLFKDRVEEALARHQRLGTAFAALLLDLDKFKGVNDTLGHQAGDALLSEVARRITGAIREVDVAARLGGDEFAVIALPGEGTLAEGADALAARLIAAIGAPYQIDGHPVVVGCSIGIALVPQHGARIDEVLRNADLALYKSKSSGRNCFHVYTQEMKDEADRRSALEIDLREAIWGDQIQVHYQPVVDLASGRVVSVEALARWTHNTKGAIAPAEFIPVAEEAGLIVELGNLVMLRACRDAMRMPDHISVAVNLSPVQFAKSNVAEAAQFALSESGLPADRLEFEITEGVLMEETEQNLATLRQIKEIGISIALDDFGVGYSSLSYLTAFPFNKVKIDKSFIDRLERPEAGAVIASIVQLAGSLDLMTVAEGIETEEQLARIRALGIKLGQGFVLSRPVPFGELQFAKTGKILPPAQSLRGRPAA